MAELVVCQTNLEQKSNALENLRQSTVEIKKACDTVCKKIHSCDSQEILMELRCKIRSNTSILANLESEIADRPMIGTSDKDRGNIITLKREMDLLSVKVDNLLSYIEAKQSIDTMLKEAMANASSDIKNLSSMEEGSHLQKGEEFELQNLAKISIALDGLEEITKKIPNLEKKGKHPLRSRWEKVKAAREKKLKTLRRITNIWASFEEIKHSFPYYQDAKIS